MSSSRQEHRTSTLNQQSGDIDVVIIGAGFAGITASRELTRRGYSTVILEARDRIGGRTLTRDWNGTQVELGGQWVHWLQPHVWSEITRYGLALYERARVDMACWLSEGRSHQGTPEDFHHLYADAWSRLFAEATRAFPRPHEPLAAREELEPLDELSIGERLEELQLEPPARDAVRALASVGFNAPCDDGALTQIMRRLALVGGHADVLAQALAVFKLRDGTRALLDAIWNESDAELRLGTAVRRVSAVESGVVVETTDGDEHHARAAIVTAPISTLSAIDFSPALSAGKRAISADGQMTRGAMVWLRLRNVPSHVLLMAPPEHLLTYVYADFQAGEDVIANAFAPVAARLELRDGRQLQAALRDWLPEVTLVDFVTHDWTGDRFSKQTWTMLRPRQLTEHFADLQRAEGPVHFAGADYASGWFGFIDGAIESAHAAARAGDQFISGAARPPATSRREAVLEGETR